jgi:hypothetical protein
MPAFDVDQFERAAAEITDHSVGPLDAGDDPESGKLRLAISGKQRDRRAYGLGGGGEKIGTVHGIAGGGGRKDVELADTENLAEDTEPTQRGERLGHARLLEASRARDTVGERAKSLLVEDRTRRPAQRLIGDETHRVRTDVNDRKGGLACGHAVLGAGRRDQ